MAAKPMVLIVDDEKPTRDGLRAALEERYDVYVAEDARAACTLLELRRPRTNASPHPRRRGELKLEARIALWQLPACATQDQTVGR